MKRRDFLKNTIVAIAGASVPLSALEFIDPQEVLAANPDIHWAFLINTHTCVGCGFCVKACKTENDIPFEANVSRTWVERYVFTKDDRRYIDSPKAALYGFTDSKVDLGEHLGFKDIEPENVGKAFFVPKLCNHCEAPACTQVCPVGATYKTDDGIVLIDRSWCIGCGYCVMACPFGARFFHPVHNVVDKCTFCYHRITKDLETACVNACPFGARKMCNIRDINDPITKIILNDRVGVLKDEFGTKPQAFYIGLATEVR
ncbi:MAG: 4Fe-4S dicluster domain-containing protein [Deltaproteobacteria bacterium]|jgi:Fe-S-cluster-containing dehydrogenase component|nr:4Fe-4S dicluster domain-containing protein [Deltaproteobacteria bacterium]MBW2476374.1 4Fe-4S dicluster domain-containing protein [Deltaproteobacteria bacterium]MBW2519443.1 4Fe-4S dicluster domain-containing protein [Deltaproteobacteria bacterium]